MIPFVQWVVSLPLGVSSWKSLLSKTKLTGTCLTMLAGMWSAPSCWRSSPTATSISCSLLVDTVWPNLFNIVRSSVLPVTLRTAIAKETCLGVSTLPFLLQNRMSWQIDNTFAWFDSRSSTLSSVKFSSPVTIQDTRLNSMVGIDATEYSFVQRSGVGGHAIFSVNCNCSRTCLPNKYALSIGFVCSSFGIRVKSSSIASSSASCSMSLQFCTT